VASPVLAPSSVEERISSIDTLRGVAVLGILLVNIISFGLPSAADDDPNAYGGGTGVNLAFWLVNQVFFEGKMRALFSMLFGASVVLFTTRISRKTGGEEVADIYYRRTIWLAVLGAMHGVFLWEGDILFSYGLAGIVLYLFRKLRPWLLVLLGLLALALGLLALVGEQLDLGEARLKAEAARRAQDAGEPLTEKQQANLKAWEDKRKEAKTSKDDLDKEIDAKRGSYLNAFKYRRGEMTNGRAVTYFNQELLDVFGMMLIGMGLFKWGVFSAELGNAAYGTLMVLGYGVGVPLNAYVGFRLIGDGFEVGVPAQLVRAATYDLGRLSVALGHVGLVMWLCKAGRWPGLTRRLGAVGQMALTNYLMQTLLCTTFFYGYGLGYFASFGRAQLLLIVAVVWALELSWSPLWLRVFRFGPAEWVWRWLSYCRRPPLLRGEKA